MAATLGLILLVGGSTYAGLAGYFGRAVDLDLKYKMASQFQLFGFSLPEELEDAQSAWLEEQAEVDQGSLPLIDPNSFAENPEEVSEREAEEAEEDPAHEQQELLENAYGSGAIQIFVLPLDEAGTLLFNPNPYPLPMEPNQASSQEALAQGSDLRFDTLPTGERVRLLSYRTSPGTNPAVLQVGRLLVDQDRVFSEVATSIGIAGFLIMALVGMGSWWMAGRTLVPAQLAWDQQQTFVANASHELRTPLTLLRASTEVALRGDVGPKEATLLKDVLNETDYMGRLVGDLLLLSRLDAGGLNLQLEAVPIANLLDDVQTQVKKLPGGEWVTVEQDPVAEMVLADRTRLRQVLLILLDNAINHNPQNTPISVQAKALDKQIEFSVADQGPGIPIDHLEHIFERFYQINSQNKEVRSHGLGLSIAKGLVELHKGTIKVESQPGEGTRFIITLPKAN